MAISSPRSPLLHSMRNASATPALCSSANAGAKTLPASQPRPAASHIAPASAANRALNWPPVRARGGRSLNCAPAPPDLPGSTSITSPTAARSCGKPKDGKRESLAAATRIDPGQGGRARAVAWRGSRPRGPGRTGGGLAPHPIRMSCPAAGPPAPVKPSPPAVDAAEVEALFDSIPDVLFFIKDREGRYTHVNATMLRRLGLRSRKEIIGKRASEVYPSGLGANYGLQDRQVLEGAVIDNLLELHLFSDQEPGWCLTCKRPLRIDGQVAGLIGISRDLAGREGLEADYRSLREALVHMNRHYAE